MGWYLNLMSLFLGQICAASLLYKVLGREYIWVLCGVRVLVVAYLVGAQMLPVFVFSINTSLDCAERIKVFCS